MKNETLGKRCSEDILNHVDEWGERAHRLMIRSKEEGRNRMNLKANQ